MATRIAASISLIVFAVCLVVGGIQADNGFATAVIRALVAMLGTFALGLVVGWMAQKMLDENLAHQEHKLAELQKKSQQQDR
jgi:NhaP-type Na+/H+ or K+/H+ antiporter